MAGVLERIRMSQAISLWEAQDDEIGALGPHERWIRRREAKVSDVGGKKTLRLSPNTI